MKAISLVVEKAEGWTEVQGGVVDEIQGVLGVVHQRIVEVEPHHTAINFNTQIKSNLEKNREVIK